MRSHSAAVWKELNQVQPAFERERENKERVVRAHRSSTPSRRTGTTKPTDEEWSARSVISRKEIRMEGTHETKPTKRESAIKTRKATSSTSARAVELELASPIRRKVRSGTPLSGIRDSMIYSWCRSERGCRGEGSGETGTREVLVGGAETKGEKKVEQRAWLSVCDSGTRKKGRKWLRGVPAPMRVD